MGEILQTIRAEIEAPARGYVMPGNVFLVFVLLLLASAFWAHFLSRME